MNENKKIAQELIDEAFVEYEQAFKGRDLDRASGKLSGLLSMAYQLNVISMLEYCAYSDRKLAILATWNQSNEQHD